YGQHNSTLEVNYGITINPSEESELEKILSSMGNIYEAAKEVDFTLMCNNEQSIFFENEKSYSSKSLVSLSLVHAGYSGRVKQKNNINYVENDSDQKAIVTH